MLIYDPALDFRHAIFRLLLIIRNSSEDSIELDRYRIIDFYTLYPGMIAAFKMPRNLYTEVKKYSKSKQNKYNTPNNPIFSFSQLHDIQKSAIDYLASIELIGKDYSKSSLLLLKNQQNFPELLGFIDSSRSIDTNYDEVLWDFFMTYPLLGKDGLKARSGLLEYRYDAT